MRRMTYFVMALALVLGLAQCKKEQLVEPQGEQVRITLNVNNGNSSKAEVVPPHVNFVNGDQILVASGGHYVGTLTYDGTNFSGDITNPAEGEPLYFYFLGNNAVLNAPVDDEIKGCTVNISDQTGYPALPVISMGVSIDRANHNAIVNYSSQVDSYEAQLHNKASLMKFKVTTNSNAAVCITGMNNKVTVNFYDRSENDGFSYGKADTEGVIKLKSGSGTEVEKWAIVLKQVALDEGAEGTTYTEDGVYVGARSAIPAIDMDEYFDTGIDLTVNESAVIDFSTVTGDIIVGNHMTLSGTLNEIHKISIADGASVTLDGVNINIPSGSGYNYTYGGLTCLGNATIILEGENVVNGGEFPGITVSSGSSDTLTIEGTGRLDVSASPNYNSPSIGRRSGNNGGNINIKSGSIYANSCIGGTVNSINISGGYIEVIGGQYRSHAAIGSQADGTCGSINITGGEIHATGGPNGGAGIGSGSGSYASCGAITISGASTIVATGGNSSSGEFGAGIGSGYYGSCGVITINSGDITATGAGARLSSAAGIGTGVSGKCADIIIGNGVTQVTSIRKNTNNQNGDRIGKGKNGTLTSGHLTIGGNTYDPDPTAVTGFTVTRNNTTWTIEPASN